MSVRKVLVVVVGTSDIVVWITIQKINEVRLRADTPPTIDVGLVHALVFYGIAFAILLGVTTIRPTVGGSWKSCFHAIAILLAVRAIGVIGVLQSPRDGYRIELTEARVRFLKNEFCKDYQKGGVVSAPNVDLQDGWGFSFEFREGASPGSLVVMARGAPSRIARKECGRPVLFYKISCNTPETADHGDS